MQFPRSHTILAGKHLSLPIRSVPAMAESLPTYENPRYKPDLIASSLHIKGNSHRRSTSEYGLGECRFSSRGMPWVLGLQ